MVQILVAALQDLVVHEKKKLMSTSQRSIVKCVELLLTENIRQLFICYSQRGQSLKNIKPNFRFYCFVN